METNIHLPMEMQYLIIRRLVWRYHGNITIFTTLNPNDKTFLNFIC
jgi:hypothetical protein